MPRKAANEIAAGAFVLLGLAAGLGVILWLGSKRVLEKPQSQAFFYRDYAAGPTGLRGGSEVRLGDMMIGRVARIIDQPDKSRSLYVVDLSRTDLQLHPYGTASVPFVMVGDTHLSVRGLGDANFGPTTKANAIPISGGIQAITDAVTEATDSLKKAAAAVNRQLEANQPGTVLAKLHGILRDVADVAANIRDETDPNRAESFLARLNDIVANIRNETDPNRAGSFLARLNDSADTLDRILQDAKPKVGKTLADVSETVARLRQYADANLGALLVRVHDISSLVLKSVGELSEKAKALVDHNSAGLDAVVQNFVLVSADLKATAAEVRRHPWRLLYRPDDKELRSANILDAARAFSAGAEQLDEIVTRLKTIDPKTASPEELQRLRDRLRESFGKFTEAEQALLKELGKDK